MNKTNYIDEMVDNYELMRLASLIGTDAKNPKENFRTFLKKSFQKVEQQERERITKLFDRKMLKTKNERPDVSCHRGGYNQRIKEEWAIIDKIRI